MHHGWGVINIRAVLIFLFLFVFFHSSAQASLVASTPGEFSVSSTGAASYSVPIVVPPGTAGLEPKFSLNYSSQGRNGLLGVGWMIGGLSSLHRCQANLVKDGFIDGIDFDNNDRFCLDGQPLIAVDSSGNKLTPQKPAYGANGTEYRTEINGFSKIISYGSTGNGPSYFKVWTKSGEIMEYGNTTDSLINPLLTPHSEYQALGRNTQQRKKSYRELFRHHIDDKDLHAIQAFWQSGTPLGNDRFRAKIERTLKTKVGQRTRGRPKSTTKKEL